MNKPTLTKEQAGMLENHRNNFENLMMKRIAKGCPTYLVEVPVEDVVIAFFDGYTVEQTPEEKVREYYEKLEPKKHYMETQKSHCSGERFATRRVLDLLNITIKGVNDKYE